MCNPAAYCQWERMYDSRADSKSKASLNVRLAGYIVVCEVYKPSVRSLSVKEEKFVREALS